MKIVIFPFFLIMAVFGWDRLANAQGQVLECGTALATVMEVNPGGKSADYCNLYDRRLNYAQNQKDLRNKIDLRRESYHTPMKQARDNYAQAIEESYAAEENKPVTLGPASGGNSGIMPAHEAK